MANRQLQRQKFRFVFVVLFAVPAELARRLVEHITRQFAYNTVICTLTALFNVWFKCCSRDILSFTELICFFQCVNLHHASEKLSSTTFGEKICVISNRCAITSERTISHRDEMLKLATVATGTRWVQLGEMITSAFAKCCNSLCCGSRIDLQLPCCLALHSPVNWADCSWHCATIRWILLGEINWRRYCWEFCYDKWRVYSWKPSAIKAAANLQP